MTVIFYQKKSSISGFVFSLCMHACAPWEKTFQKMHHLSFFFLFYQTTFKVSANYDRHSMKLSFSRIPQESFQKCQTDSQFRQKSSRSFQTPNTLQIQQPYNFQLFNKMCRLVKKRIKYRISYSFRGIQSTALYYVVLCSFDNSYQITEQYNKAVSKEQLELKKKSISLQSLMKWFCKETQWKML